MKKLTIKTGLVIGSIVFGFGLEKISKLNNNKTIKRFAKKSKDFGIVEGEKVIKSIAEQTDIDLDFVDVFFSEFHNIINSNEKNFETEKFHIDNDINVVFLEDEKEMFLLPPYKKTS